MLEQIASILCRRQEYLATAESCTGGRIASRITSIAGSSEWFKGGVVAYSNEIKETLLNVPNDLLQKFGAVSEEVALAMARGASSVLGTTIALSTTGIAGPSGGTLLKPIGTVWIAITYRQQLVSKLLHLTGSRLDIQEKATEEALRLLYEVLIASS